MIFETPGDVSMYNARQVEAKKKEEEKVSSIERMLRKEFDSNDKPATTEKRLEGDRTGNTHVTTEKQLDKMREGTREAITEKRLNDEKPAFGKNLRSDGGKVSNVPPLDAARKDEPGKYKPANGKKK
jgi:hypothetical protein